MGASETSADDIQYGEKTNIIKKINSTPHSCSAELLEKKWLGRKAAFGKAVIIFPGLQLHLPLLSYQQGTEENSRFSSKTNS